MSTDLKCKSILFLDAYYEPEQIAFTHLENDLITGLIEKGYCITIICPQPSRGIDKATHDYYKNKNIECFYDGKLIVKRFNCQMEKNGIIKRFFRYVYTNLMTLKMGKREKNVDYVFCNSTPPTQGLIAGKVKKYLERKYKKKIPFIYNLQDLFPDSLISSEITKQNSLIHKIGKVIEKKTYSYADEIVVISNDFKRNLLNKGINNDKLHVLYNWIDVTDVFYISRERNKLVNELKLNVDDKVVVYAGNFGMAQNIDVIVETAKRLAAQNIKFVLFGRGSEYERIKELSKTIDNISIHPLLPVERVSEVYSLGDINLITCKKGFGKCSFPSKTWSILACNSPIVASYDVESELNEVLENNEFGKCVEPDDSQKLADAIVSTLGNKINSREFVENKASKAKAIELYCELFS